MSMYPTTAAITASLCSQPDAQNKSSVCAGLLFQENLAKGNGFIKIPAAGPTCDKGSGDYCVVPASGVLSYAIAPFPTLQC
jgi:hypothetical protein